MVDAFLRLIVLGRSISLSCYVNNLTRKTERRLLFNLQVQVADLFEYLVSLQAYLVLR